MLYKKYRPQELTGIFGNPEVVRGLMKALERDTPHSILLTGPTGCGKTTIARIIANRLGCVESEFREIDSADFRGIDTIREIRKSSGFRPIKGPRVWLVDECHKMTNDAQNAFLKLLEDTPGYTYFILATTDPQKLLPTIKGRCSTFALSLLDETSMMRLLRSVVKAEGENLSKLVYEQIILDSMGHPRNALQILDQVLRVDNDHRLIAAKKSAEEQSQSIELCRALIGHKGWKEVALILNGLKEQDPEGIRRHVLGYAQSVLLKKENTQAAIVLEEFIEPFYNSGFPQLVYACYSVINGGE